MPTGDLAYVPFNHQHPYPDDLRKVRDTINERDTIIPSIRYEGMIVYVLENTTTYQLKGGLTNEFWVILGTGVAGGGTGETTDMAAEDFYQGMLVEGQPDEYVIYAKGPKDIIYPDGGAQILYPAFMGNLVITMPSTINGVGYAELGNEFSITNHSTGVLIVTDNFLSAPAQTAFDLGGANLEIQVAETAYFNGNGTDWEVGTSNIIGFSDALNSVNATFSVGRDGLKHISGVFDKVTGEQVEFKEFTGATPTTDGIIFMEIDGTYYKRIFPNRLDVRWWGAVGNGVADDTIPLQDFLAFCDAIGLKASLRDVNILVTSPIDSLVSIEGISSKIIAGANMDYILKPTASGITFRNLEIDGGSFTVSGIYNDAPLIVDVAVDNCNIHSCNGNGFYSNAPCQLINNLIDDCGVYPSLHAVYVLNDSLVFNNKITNSKYKALIVGTAGERNKFDSNIIDTTTGAASTGIYFSISSKDNIAINNTISNTEDSSIKVTQLTEDNFVLDNKCDGVIMMQGSQNCVVERNVCLQVRDLAHTSVPSIASKIRNNTCGSIALGGGSSNLFGFIDQTEVIGNTTDNIICTGGSCKGFRIERNIVAYISIDIDTTLSINSYEDESVKIIGNEVSNENEFPAISIRGLFFTSQPTKLLLDGNIVKHSSVATSAVYVRYFNEVNAFNNNIDGGNYSLELYRILLRCNVFQNRAFNYVLKGYHLSESSSATYWSGSINDYLVYSNIGSVEPTTSGRFRTFNNVVDMFVPTVSDIPTGYYRVGTIRQILAPTRHLFLVCTVSGSPGTWEPCGLIGEIGDVFDSVHITAPFDLTPTPTESFHKYNTGAASFVGSPDDGEDWDIRRFKADSHGVAVDVAIDRSGSGDMYTNAYTGVWEGWVKVGGFYLDVDGNAVIANTKKVGNGVVSSSNWTQYGNGANIYNVPTSQQHLFYQNGVQIAGINGDGKFFIEGVGKGIILKSPDGTQYELTVPNGGASVTITAV